MGNNTSSDSVTDQPAETTLEVITESRPANFTRPPTSAMLPPPSMRAPTTHSRQLRERYMARLASHRTSLVRGFIPNLEPLLGRTPRGSLAQSLVGSESGGGDSNYRWPMSSPQSSASNMDASGPDRIREIDEDEDGPRPVFAAGSMKSSIFNLMAATLGAGALSLPFAVVQSGVFLAIPLCLLMGGLCLLSVHLIICAIERTQKNSYEEIAVISFGKKFGLAVEFAIIFFCFGTAVAYLISVGDIGMDIVNALFPPCDPHDTTPCPWWKELLVNRPVFLTIMTITTMLPMAMAEQINELRFVCVFGVACIAWLVLVVFIVMLRTWYREAELLATYSEAKSMLHWEVFWPTTSLADAVRATSLFIFAFCCQPNVPGIYCELERKSFRRMHKVTLRAVIIIFVMYAIIGISGALLFGNKTQANILSNLEPYLHAGDLWVISAYIAIFLAVVLAYPLNIFPIRFAVETVLVIRFHIEDTPSTQNIVVIVTVLCSLFCGIMIPSINIVFSFVGATAGTFVCFVAPAVFFLQTVNGAYTVPIKYKAWFLLVVGSFLGCIGTYCAFADMMMMWFPVWTASSPFFQLLNNQEV